MQPIIWSLIIVLEILMPIGILGAVDAIAMTEWLVLYEDGFERMKDLKV